MTKCAYCGQNGGDLVTVCCGSLTLCKQCLFTIDQRIQEHINNGTTPEGEVRKRLRSAAPTINYILNAKPSDYESWSFHAQPLDYQI
jgi:hypothetical protein